MTHEQLVSKCFLWHWNTFPMERKMLYAVNNNSANRVEGNRNKAKGVVAGVLDFCYVGWWSVCWLDAKVGKDTLSEEQKDFISKCEERGHRCYIFSSLEEFQKIILCQRNSGK